MIRTLGRIILLVTFLFSSSLFAKDDISVVDIRRNIQMSEQDSIYKDFYIDAGLSSGLKKNMTIQATRKVSIKDSTGTKSIGDIVVPVGELKIIYSNEYMSVARETKLLSREEFPMLEQMAIMIGDKIEISPKK